MMIELTNNLNLWVLGNGVGSPLSRELRRVRKYSVRAATVKTILPTPWITIPASYHQT